MISNILRRGKSKENRQTEQEEPTLQWIYFFQLSMTPSATMASAKYACCRQTRL
jgi:hypothetical protein